MHLAGCAVLFRSRENRRKEVAKRVDLRKHIRVPAHNDLSYRSTERPSADRRKRLRH